MRNCFFPPQLQYESTSNKLHDFKMASNLPGSNEQTNKVDFRVFILRDHNFVVDSGGWRPGEHKQVKHLAF